MDRDGGGVSTSAWWCHGNQLAARLLRRFRLWSADAQAGGAATGAGVLRRVRRALIPSAIALSVPRHGRVYHGLK